MHMMEGQVGSGVVKKKSSSGCLMIKKAGAKEEGLGGLCDSRKGEKRARLISSGSDSSSSDEDEPLEFMRRKMTEKRLKKGSTGYKSNELEVRERVTDNAGIDVSAEKKRSRLDLFEFDEYDEFDGKKMRNEFLQDRFNSVGRNDSGNVKKYGVSSNRNLGMDKRKQGSNFGSSNSGKTKGVGGSGMRNKGLSSEDDEAHMPISLLKMKYRETAAESIRLPGKNGVLKVMVNKKKKMDFPSQPKNHDPVEELSAELPVYPDSKTPKNRGLVFGKKRTTEKEKGETKLEKAKPSSNEDRKARDSGEDGTDAVAMPTQKACSSKKGVKMEAERSPSTESFPTIKGKEGKESNAKSGGGNTEKQMLREKIRGMLMDAGWSIDYRPRRNRDYLDAVYINPGGTAYWSIIKAYDAFKKQLGEDDDRVNENTGSPSFAPLSEDLINKLTRQTKKKIAQEQKKKRKQEGMAKSVKKSAVREAVMSSDSDQSEERLSSYMKHNQKLRGKFYKVDQESDDDSLHRKSKKVESENPSPASKSNTIQGRTSEVIGRYTLLVRGSDRGDNSDFDGYVPYRGKRTVLAWLIDCGTAKLSQKVQYMNRRRTKVMLEGWITRDGIHCGCCSKILTVSKFELHAGSKLRQPFQNIFLESGSSLLQCQIDAWNSQDESLHEDFFTVAVDGDDPDDDTCGICGDGGDLICCDSCPSTFHQNCLGIQILPSGDWHCPNCTCKFCGLASGNMAEEKDNGSDEFNRCNFCEKKYHKSCSERANALPTTSYTASFCGQKCQEIYGHLQKILGIKHELETGISWSLIQRADVSDASLRGFPLRVECNSKLAVALSIMDECFLPITDRGSGINIIHNVVYNLGSNFNRLNYRGFYTAILERGDEIIAAASIRLHGDCLAEMPFIGTREIYRRQGMCRRLLSAIETELCSLKVGQLIIPAISEHMNTWTTIFGFDELEDIHRKEIKSMNMLVFPGTDMLQKQLLKQENSDGVKPPELNKNEPLAEKVKVSSSGEQNRPASSDSGDCPTSKASGEVDGLDSGSTVTAIPSDALLETDNPAPNTSESACESEMGDKQRGSSDNLKLSPIPAEESNVSDEEHRLPEPPAEADSTSLVKAEAFCESEVDALQKGSSDNLKLSPSHAEDGIISAEEHRLPEPPAEDDSSSLVKADAFCESEVEIKKTESSDHMESSPIYAEDGNISNKEHRLPEPPAEADSSSSVYADAFCESEMENKKSESSDHMESSPIHAEDDIISNEEHRLPEPPAEDDSNSRPGIENGIAESSVSEKDAAQLKTGSNGCVESAEVETGVSNADEDHISLDAKADGVLEDKPKGEVQRSPPADGDVDPPCQLAAPANHAR